MKHNLWFFCQQNLENNLICHPAVKFALLNQNSVLKAAMGRAILGSGEEESDPNWLRLLLRHYFRALLSALSALFDESIDRSRALLASNSFLLHPPSQESYMPLSSLEKLVTGYVINFVLIVSICPA